MSCARVRSSSRRRLSASSSSVATRPSSTGHRRAQGVLQLLARAVLRSAVQGSSCCLEGARLPSAWSARSSSSGRRAARLAGELAEVLQLLERLAVLVLEQPRRSSAAVPASSALRRASPSSRSPGCGDAARTGGSWGCGDGGARRSRSGALPPPRGVARHRTRPDPTPRASRTRTLAFVFHGPGAVAMGVSGRVSSTTAGRPTPERNRRGSMIETSPWIGGDLWVVLQRFLDVVLFARELVADPARPRWSRGWCPRASTR